MQDSPSLENDFLGKITGIITENISNENFGVSELANEIGMSRSNLLRKVKNSTKLSVSQFIRQVRLQHALEILKQTSLTVSEITYKVGFSSTSYFIKCFREYYGYSPGEVGKREVSEKAILDIEPTKKKSTWVILAEIIGVVLVAIVLYVMFKPELAPPTELEKSIAVLPFKNDSNDSTNVHIINGLMESILNNLQKIEDLRVVSRTSIEKYRNSDKTIPEMAEELNVSYFIEGSGQKIGDQIQLNIQLIEARKDNHLWAEQYNREAKDIFKLQREVAKSIADEIQVIITPDEEANINKVLTDNFVAYDYFLKGRDLLYTGSDEDLKEAITYFEKAIAHDSEFASAYADIAIAYYFVDVLQAEKKYTKQISHHADQALLFDSTLPQSLIAKALFYMSTDQNKLAVPYFEKALQYNPNSALVINFLSDFYANYVPDTEKYLEYALKGIELDIAAHDSVTASFIYLHVSNAFIQTGFVNEAEKYINKSLEYDQGNIFSEYVKAYILFARNGDLEQTRALLIETLNKDTTRLDVLQEVGKICYYMRDYDSAYYYYEKFINARTVYNLDIYRHQNALIGAVLAKVGEKKESELLLADYKDWVDGDESIYKHFGLAMYYAHEGDTKKAIEHMQLFAEEDNYHYWTILFVKIDPMIDNVKEHPEFRKLLNELDIKFWESHKRIKVTLQGKELI